jgi:alpha-tubulin suppressor-like RCC1 family protein
MWKLELDIQIWRYLMIHYLKHLFLCASIALLAACGAQEGTSTDVAGINTFLTAPNNIAPTPANSDSKLLASLATTYPGGQLPQSRAAQAAEDLRDNPATLQLTAETAPLAQSQITAQSLTIQPQATAADYQPVQRIQNTTLYGAYFFSIYPGEVASALVGNPNWRLEGPAFWASLQTGLDLFPVHRFQNKLNGSYLYTIYEGERANIVASYSATFAYEGIAWYARQTPTQAPGWSALYRFRNKTNGTYLFSAYEAEKDAIVANYPAVFELEGIAYYVRQEAPSAAGNSPIAASDGHTCAINNNATVSCWGNNSYGQLGDGTTAIKTSPTAVLGLSGVSAIATGYGHSCALKNNGTVSCWGFNGYGALGDGSTTNKSSPTAVLGLSGVSAIATGAYHTCALKNNGTVSCWGYNGSGQLGDGTTISSNSPTAAGLSGVTALVAGGSQSCALKNNGTVSCWGDNLYGQLGDGTTASKVSPTAVLGLTGVAAIATGIGHSCALKNDGSVSCWGYNGYGALGDGSTTSKTSPTAVPGLSGVSAIATGASHTCSLKNNGSVSCWGWNNAGQLGDGTLVNKSTSTAVPGLSGVTAIATGYAHSCALKNDGTANCWGNNNNGQLGDATLIGKTSPIAVLGVVVFWK